jgi:hypothetical protein
MKLSDLKEKAAKEWAENRKPGVDPVNMPKEYFEDYFKEYVLHKLDLIAGRVHI